MRDRKKRTLMIGALCCLLVFMGIGYAILSQTLNIDGTAALTGEWDIHIESITELSDNNETTGKSISANVSEDKLTATFAVELLKPGDYVEYNIVVKNAGNIDATLRDIETSMIDNEFVKFNHNATLGNVVRKTDTLEFKVKVTFDEESPIIPDDKEYIYSLSLVFEQYDGNQLTTPPNMDTNNSCFTVSADGVLENYDYKCGLDVVVPESVDGIPITSITTNSFAASNETLKEMGYGRYRSTSFFFHDESTQVRFHWAEDDYSFEKLIEKDKVENIELEKSNNYIYAKGKLEETYVYTYGQIIPLDSEGNEEWDNPTYSIYAYIHPTDFFVAETQEAYEAMLIFAQNNGFDTNSVYLAGDPDIPRETYRVKLSDVLNGEIPSIIVGDDNWVYTNVTTTVLNSLSGIITTLDLSNAIYLEEITTNNQFKSLEKLILPSNGNLKTIGESAFELTNLSVVTIPSTVKTIGKDAFDRCSNLKYIYMEPYSKSVTLGEKWNGTANPYWLNG